MIEFCLTMHITKIKKNPQGQIRIVNLKLFPLRNSIIREKHINYLFWKFFFDVRK